MAGLFLNCGQFQKPTAREMIGNQLGTVIRPGETWSYRVTDTKTELTRQRTTGLQLIEGDVAKQLLEMWLAAGPGVVRIEAMSSDEQGRVTRIVRLKPGCEDIAVERF